MDEKKIHSIIDEAMAARDRSVSIYISPDGGVSVSVFPWPDEETLRNMRASGLISHNDYRTRLGLSPYERLRMSTMNEKVLRHKEICDGLNELYARKNHDYGDSFHTTFVEEGLAMARIRLGDKFSRFKTLSRLSCNDRDQQQVTDESIRDTLLDLANYAIMTVLEMDAPDESHATMYAYDKPFYTVGEDK